MNPLTAIARWLDIRPEEYVTFGLSCLGAFLVISFLIAARSLREALYLARFPVETLPYIIAGTAVMGVPAVALFTRLLATRSPERIYRLLLWVLAAGLAALGVLTAVAATPPLRSAAIVLVYLWTAVGTLLLTSGFWVVTSEHFALRDAKRLFGMISGGGTIGAMVTGTLLGPFTESLGVLAVIPLLIAILAVSHILQLCMPERARRAGADTIGRASDTGILAGLELVFRTPHLRAIALVVGIATMASTIVDYQFKDLVRAQLTTGQELTSFFGAFYGITGIVALLVQVLLASRLLASGGVAWSLAVLPLVLLLGSTGLLMVPGLAVAVAVRGADNALRKSLHRSVIEYLFVPVPSGLRRRTKAFVDTTVDSGAEGIGAAVVYLLVTVGGLPSRYLSLVVIVLSVGFLFVARHMGAEYFRTLLSRLREEQDLIDEGDDVFEPFAGGETLNVTMTRYDLQTVLSQSGIDPADPPAEAPPARGDTTGDDTGERSLTDRLGSADTQEVSAALEADQDWSREHFPALVRLLARDTLYRRAARVLASLGPGIVADLRELLLDESADFVIRRRIPRVLARIADRSADSALIDGLSARRFEVRYRCGVALARRRRAGLPTAAEERDRDIWNSIRGELGRERPIWELQRLLDDVPETDDFVTDRVYHRGELSLEHTFRLLSLVLDPEPVRTAFGGVVMDDERLRSISLEYLEQVLPADIRRRLWPFIGDISDYHRDQQIRPMDDVVADLLKTGATLFEGELERARLREALDRADDEDGDG